MTRKIVFACDHVVVPYYEEIIRYIKAAGSDIEVEYLGPKSNDAVDYPDYAAKVATAVSKGEAVFGVLVCGSGIGMSIVANKYPGIRAGLCHDHLTAKLTREHNDANILCAGVFTSAMMEIEDMIHTFINTPFTNEASHNQRIDKIKVIEQQQK